MNSVHGVVNHVLISLIYLLILSKNMLNMNIHLIISNHLHIKIVQLYMYICICLYRDVTLFYFSPSSQKITVTKSSDPKYQFLHERFLNEFK